MELAALFFGTLGSAAGAGTAAAATSAAAWAAGTTVTTAAGVTSGLGAASGALSVLQGVATAASMASTLVGGLSAAGSAATNASLAKLQGEADYVASEQAALRIRRDAVQKIGAARVAFAGSGLDISSADGVVGDINAQANFETSVEMNNAKLRTATAAAKARAYKMQGGMDLLGAAAKAAGQGAQFGIDIANRG